MLAIFDIDGTLTRTNAIDTDCYVRALGEAFGIDGVDRDWGSYQHTTDGGTFAEIFRRRFARDPNANDIAAMREAFVALLLAAADAHFVEIDGARVFLDALREAGVNLALASGAWRAAATMKLRRAGFAVDDLPSAFGDDAIARVDIMRIARQRAAVRYGSTAIEPTIYVGDAVWDVRAACELHWPIVVIGDGPVAERFGREGAALVIADYRELTVKRFMAVAS